MARKREELVTLLVILFLVIKRVILIPRPATDITILLSALVQDIPIPQELVIPLWELELFILILLGIRILLMGRLRLILISEDIKIQLSDRKRFFQIPKEIELSAVAPLAVF